MVATKDKWRFASWSSLGRNGPRGPSSGPNSVIDQKNDFSKSRGSDEKWTNLEPLGVWRLEKKRSAKGHRISQDGTTSAAQWQIFVATIRSDKAEALLSVPIADLRDLCTQQTHRLCDKSHLVLAPRDSKCKGSYSTTAGLLLTMLENWHSHPSVPTNAHIFSTSLQPNRTSLWTSAATTTTTATTTPTTTLSIACSTTSGTTSMQGISLAMPAR